MATKSKSWHRLSSEYQQRILKRGGITFWQFAKRYKQPYWCGYPGGLMGAMGCWSLMIPGRIRSIASCGDCELIKIGRA